MAIQQGFTLVELMIVVAIVAILGSIGVPAYQGYLQKAAMTDMLQTLAPYKTAVDLCALEQSNVSPCSAGNYGIPTGKGSRYVSDVTVNQGIITLTGQATLQGMSVTLTPRWDTTASAVNWSRQCHTSTQAETLLSACLDMFRFGNAME